MKNIKILTSHICACKCMQIPPVLKKEQENIIRYRLSSFYPGSVEELLIDYIKSENNFIVFYMSKDKMEKIKRQNPDSSFLSSYHLFDESRPIFNKYVILDERIEFFTESEQFVFELRSLPHNEKNITLLLKDGYTVLEDYKIDKKRFLFSLKRKTNYTLQILSLVFFMALTPLLANYFQYKSDEVYLKSIENQMNQILVEDRKNKSSESELEVLKSEYSKFMSNKPISIYSFFSELSQLLGSDTEIESIVIKNNSFQMNAWGYKPLNKMEGFQDNKHFSDVIPYQVQSIENSTKEKFTLTGFYDYE